MFSQNFKLFSTGQNDVNGLKRFRDANNSEKTEKTSWTKPVQMNATNKALLLVRAANCDLQRNTESKELRLAYSRPRRKFITGVSCN